MKRALLALGLLSLACGGAPGPLPPAKSKPVPHVEPPPPDPEAWRSTIPAASAVVAHEYPEIATTTLPNGLSLYVVQRPVGIVALSLVARGGASTVPAGKSGVAALTMRMMTEGTKKRNSLALAEAVEAMGSSLEESASRDSVRLGMTVLRDDLEAGLTLLSEVAREPAFQKSELERVRKEWLDDLETERQSPSRLASLVGLRLLLGTTLGAPVSGSRKDVTALAVPDLVRFHRETFVPENLALVVVGDVTLASVQPLAAKALGRLAGKAPKPPPPPAIPAQEETQLVHLLDRPGAVQSALFVVHPFPKREDPGHEARELLNGLFGGIFTSRLNLNLREEHAYTYGARSLDVATHAWGAFGFMTSVRTDVTAPALAEGLGELRKAKDPALGRPVTDAEVALARVDLEQSLGATLSDAGAVAARVEDLFVDRLAPTYYRQYPTILDASDARTVAAEAKRLDPEHARVVVVGDRNVVSGPLEALGFRVVPVPPELTD